MSFGQLQVTNQSVMPLEDLAQYGRDSDWSGHSRDSDEIPNQRKTMLLMQFLRSQKTTAFLSKTSTDNLIETIQLRTSLSVYS